jgi:3-hydroxyisobutyrate dehydrogenase-like beta-hydroxyacid dehydrogenase
MTSEIRHIGAVGQGIMVKLVNNVLAQAGRILMMARAPKIMATPPAK